MISDQGNWAKHQNGAFFDLINVFRKLAENSLSDIAATYFSNVVSYKEAAKAAKKDLHLKFLFPPVLSKDRGGSFPG